MSYIANPSTLLWSYLREKNKADTWCQRWFQYGQLAMALEVISLIKVLEEMPMTTDVGRSESVSALQTMLVETGLSDLAWETYEKLNEWRRLKFLRIPVVADERAPRGIGVVVDPSHDDRADEIASVHGVLRGLPSQIGSFRASQQERRGQDEEPPAIGGRWAPHDGVT